MKLEINPHREVNLKPCWQSVKKTSRSSKYPMETEVGYLAKTYLFSVELKLYRIQQHIRWWVELYLED